MTKSIIDAHKLLNVQWKDEEDQKLRDHEFTGIENISYAQENMTILLEICKFFGRDVNIMEMYALFKRILQKGANDGDYGKDVESEGKLMENFMTALGELKYMGYLSQTKQSTFIFRKNYFGKAKHQKHTKKTDTQIDKDREDIKRQFQLGNSQMT